MDFIQSTKLIWRMKRSRMDFIQRETGIPGKSFKKSSSDWTKSNVGGEIYESAAVDWTKSNEGCEVNESAAVDWTKSDASECSAKRHVPGQ
ncbi:hypothetical protein [Cohnella massiliensis]|uniref:hypothetical protein n=1 Tax=Cohnella massiliensis TaxID=1816691 RepID=UPI0009BB0534|nr:hypothetical protein [Cohnella massiliensis]